MRTIETKVYPFDELSKEAQQKAIENLYDINIQFHDWWDHTCEDAKEIGKLMGIDIENIYFSGFSSQGDGACFEGSYTYEKGSAQSVKGYAPKDKELHRIALELSKLQKKNFYQLGARVKQSGHSMHENCTDIQVWSDNEAMGGANDDAYYGLKELLRDYMKWIYSQLEKQHDYLVSDEAIKETIEANEYEFTEDGNLI